MNAAYQKLCARLMMAGVPDARFDAAQLYQFVTGRDHRLDDGPTADEAARLQVLAERRAAREPLQYLLGEWDFMDFTLKVGRGVLCPRADSEVVCETAIELLQDVEAPVVYDLCAGTGCLGLGIARAVPGAKVTCVEFSHDAWPYLTANVAALGGKTTQAELADVLTYYTQIEPASVDLIISNPPYLTAQEMESLMPETAKEPAVALDGGRDGLDFYRVLVRQYRDAVRPGGWLVLEIGYAQAEAVLALGKAAGWQGGTCRKDAGSNDRVVFFRKPLENPV
ncbi:peptide chain release factor N(5)-glutamine methyltransferase [uncultured Gemmiger sp.]|uniref:peptide chain release factor N(5)-glutamine methyltransferase n=1 Tax=uncultured Gemmiger sp. TaxID=1623490 RepID=UPI0025E28D9A|nr:peptide chain release factor N(5)-glutamine methyltransferase [uncultured Gemmiger sp.]